MRLKECLVVAVWLAGWTVVAAMVVAMEEGLDSMENLVEDSTVPPSIENKSLKELCSTRQGWSCFKLKLLRRLARYSNIPSMELLPGFMVSSNITALQQLPHDVTENQLTEAVLKSLTSLSVTVRVVDRGVMQRLREMSATMVSEEATNNTFAAVTGRRRHTPMMMAGLVSGGSMMALGMSAIAMMAGKALLASLMSLMLSALTALKSGGGGKSSYEVVHAAHDFKHRSIEVPTAEAGYPYVATRRNIYIPLNLRR